MRDSLAHRLQSVLFLLPLTMASGLALGAEDPGCTTFYTASDPRLFDFIQTRKAADFTPWQGRTIGRISLVTLPIFNEADPHENNFVFRGLNRLHKPTRAKTLNKQLLIREGEPLNVDHLHESERILRGAGYLYDAMIVPERACGDRIDLMVVVRDIWTLQPTASFKRTGGQNSTSVGIVDDNLLGLGHSLSLSWDKNAQRSGVVLNFDGQHMFDGRTELGLGYAKNDDGRRSDFTLDHPFYAFDTRWAAGITGFEDQRIETESANGITTNRYDDRLQYLEVYGGLASQVQNRQVRRWRIGMTYNNEIYDNQDAAYTAPLPVNKQFAYPWIEYERREDAFVTTSNLSQLFRNEDVNLGEEWRVRFGATTRAIRSDTDALVAQLAYNNTVSFGAHHLLRNTVGASLLWDEDRKAWENSVYGAGTNYDYFIDDNNRWHARVAVDIGEGLSSDNQLKAGGDTFLRGYPSGWQRGDRRVVVNVERRHFFDKHVLNLFRFGAAAFAEAGKAWDSTHTVMQSNTVLTDVGIGLRANSSKARPNHVMHLDFAIPLTDRGTVKKFQWSLQSQSSF
ncbi:hypothetical protein EV700_0952 [Fluviicoccus keumensis]|uniref:Surface antigen-like protein n=1 Tax=Fluviicoccus keumensis TaxID=1435465 RepID=A0A4Q7ZD62_9GAMM|nr:hypothetical protein [Fluviicoccus keumensis]RZU47983.1 hypothetical protein EV700_0952 [Fluviicoccus keumensis]